MKTIALTPVITPAVLIGAVLIAAITILANSQNRLPILSNLKVDMIVVLLLGMMMCTPGIGRIAAVHQWLHPLTILGMIVGASILVIIASVLFGFKLPLVPADFRALTVVAVLIGGKILISLIHSILIKG